MTTANSACGSPSFAIPRTNCGPTPNPTANRNSRKKMDLTLGEIGMSSCPMTTPAMSVAVTAPRPMPRHVLPPA